MIATPNLSISPQKITSFIEKASQLDDQDASPGRRPSQSGMLETLKHHDAPALPELASFIDGLNQDEQAEMVALMWLGRGDGEVAEWRELREEAAVLHNKHATAYLLAQPLLADYLTEGLATLGYRSDTN